MIQSRTREEADGSQSLITLIGKPRSFTKTYENFESHNESVIYNLHHVPKRIVQSIIDDPVYKISGASVTQNFSTERGTYDLIIRHGPENPITILSKKTEDGCQMEVYSDFHFGVTEATADAFDVEEAPPGWIYRVVSFSPAANGRFNIRRDRLKAIAKTGTEYTSQQSSSRTTETQEKKNQTTPGGAIGILTQGIIRFRRALLNRFCRYDRTADNTTSTPWEVSFTVEGPDGDEAHVFKGNQRVNDPGTPASGNYLRLGSWSRNEDGTFNWHTTEETNQFKLEVTNSWSYRTSKNRTVVIATGINQGLYQAQERVFEWVYETRKFTSEDDAYAWLRESVFWKRSECGVRSFGKARFRASRALLDADFGWQDDGDPFAGA